MSDAGLIEGLLPGGTIELRSANGREYWCHRAYNRATGKDTMRHVGPATKAWSCDSRYAGCHDRAILSPDLSPFAMAACHSLPAGALTIRNILRAQLLGYDRRGLLED